MRNLVVKIGRLAFLGFWIGNLAMAETARVTLRVVDDNGQPVAGFPVNAGFYGGDKFQGVTDESGLFPMEGRAVHWEVNWILQKETYYRSQGQYEFKGGTKDGKWQPWNPIATAVVRRVMNPIPMFWKRVEAKVPVENAPFAFDLQMGDWVAPHGRGQVLDFIFEVTRRVTSLNDYEGSLRLVFTNAFDGIRQTEGMIMESAFPFPRLAAAGGYETNYVYFHGSDPARGYYGARVDDPKKHCDFRVRSVLDNEGRLAEARYGRLTGGITLSGVASTGSARIAFAYCLNPTPNDRNMEFDPERNLFTDLAPTEPESEP